MTQHTQTVVPFQRNGQPAAPALAMHEPDYIMRLAEVTRQTGLSRSALYRRVAAGTFPRQRSLGGGQVGWLASEVHAWVAARPVVGAAI